MPNKRGLSRNENSSSQNYVKFSNALCKLVKHTGTSQEKKHRRTRKERKNCNDNEDTSLKDGKFVNKQKISSNVISNNTSFTISRPKSGVKINHKKLYERLLPVKELSTGFKSVNKTEKKDVNPKRYIARKYLSEIYEKIVIKVREIVKSKKGLFNKENTKIVIKNPYKNVKSRVNTKNPITTTEVVFLH